MRPKDGATDGGFRFAAGDRGFSRGILYAFSVWVCRVVGLTFFQARARGAGAMPLHGPAVLASIHQSLLDPWIVGMCNDRSNCYLAKEELFRIPVLGWLIRKYNSFPVPRESSAPKRALETCLGILENGRSLLMFPEGTRSADGRLQPLKRGIALMAKRAEAPVVPILVTGTRRSWPKGKALPAPGRVDVWFGRPVRWGSEIDTHETSDSFLARLEASYRRLAIAVGALEMLPDESSTGGRAREGEEPSRTPERAEGPRLLTTADCVSFAARTTLSIDGGPRSAEA